jgi:uncharacterized protein (TIGR02594 family)
MGFNHDAFMREWRASRLKDGAKISQVEYDLVFAAINGTYVPNLPAPANSKDPPWITTARGLIGTSEVVGPQHNSFISKGWARLGASWFNDDEMPWCGFFVAHCVDSAKLPFPGGGKFAQAKAWMEWGKASAPVLGAVIVFSRKGGGHVGFVVGESSTHYYVLGGNQDNCVSITPFNKTTRPPLGFRWPASLPAGDISLPKMSDGTVTKSEA